MKDFNKIMTDDGYEPGHYIVIDADVVEDSECEKCGLKHMEYHPFFNKVENSYRAVAACKKCGFYTEF